MELFNPIDETSQQIVLDRLNDEYTAHFFYSNACNHFENVGYTRLADYCHKEASDELTHALKLQKFLNDWGVFFTIPNPTVTPVFRDPYDFINKAYTLEATLYKNYNANSEQIEDIDKSMYNLFLEMVQIQYDSVAEYRTFIDKSKLYGNDLLAVKMWEDECFG